MTNKSNNNPGEIASDSIDWRRDEPSFEDFLALVRSKMIEHGEDPNAVEPDGIDFDDEDIPWLH